MSQVTTLCVSMKCDHCGITDEYEIDLSRVMGAMAIGERIKDHSSFHCLWFKECGDDLCEECSSRSMQPGG